MINLFENDVKTDFRRSSKGNQLKWETGNIWYKADYAGYEGLAEFMVSNLLQKSSLQPSEYVLYQLEQIRYNQVIYNGAKSESFLDRDWQIITLERLYQLYTGQSLTQIIWKMPDVKQRLSFLVRQVEAITGLQEFGIYMEKLLTIDAFFLNEDRHLHNIAVLMNGNGQFTYCPLFDHGGSLLSDTTMDFPLGEDFLPYIKEVKAKTCSNSFDEQLDAAEELYGLHLHLSFTRKDIEDLLTTADYYPIQTRERVETILMEQMRKYKYLF